jgi:hypothetical protein
MAKGHNNEAFFLWGGGGGGIPVEHHFERADGPALRLDGPRSEQSAPVGRTVRTCAEQFRVPSFVLFCWLDLRN